MLRMMMTVFLFGSLMMAQPAIPSSEQPSSRKGAFCPECWKFLENPWDLDLGGRCNASGKKPVEVEAVTVSWFWCRHHQAWHRRRCGRDSSVAWESTALLVPDGSEAMRSMAYCPGERMISDLGHVGLACPVCGKPFVAVEVVERRWYWCTTEKAWLGKPCPANRSLRCCSLRSGPVLASPWQLPQLNEVSLREGRLEAAGRAP